jgi:hypothetical protein
LNARIELLTSQLEDQGQQSQQQHLVSAGYASGAVLGSLGPWQCIGWHRTAGKACNATRSMLCRT